MGIRESLLNTITSVADSDFVRIVTSAGASSKATVRNLFKGFESNLSAKSSLTTSDYIRVVGSDNEAYKQSVSSVMQMMGINDVVNGTRGQIGLLHNWDIDDFATDKIYGTYYLNNSDSDVTGTKPDTGGHGLLFCKQQSNKIYRQIYIGVANSSAMKVRYYYNNAWTQWNDLPIRTEIDTVSTRTSVDYIVEQGTSGIWTYRKWNSGIAECWGWYTFAVSTWSAWGSVYESNRGETTYPSGLFTGTHPICNVTYQSGSLGTAAMSIELSGGSATATPTFWIIRPSSGGTGNALIGLRAIGRWK